jgi:hypothetical protein
MKLYKVLVISLFSTFILSACASNNNSVIEKPKVNKFSSLTDLKQAFVDAGGQCWGWELVNVNDFKNKIGQGECDSKTVLILYKDNVNTLDEAVRFRSFLLDLKFKVNLLFGDNWMINTDQVEIAYPKMGGTLMTR